MPQEDKDKNDEILDKMAIKVTKGQICDGTTSKIVSWGVLLMWKVLCFYEKVHDYCVVPLYHLLNRSPIFDKKNQYIGL